MFGSPKEVCWDYYQSGNLLPPVLKPRNLKVKARKEWASRFISHSNMLLLLVSKNGEIKKESWSIQTV